jgi:hypothetical protein
MTESLFDAMNLEPVTWMPWQIHSQESADAAFSVKPKANALREKVFEMIKAYSLTGISDQQLSLVLEMPENTVRPRRIELQKEGRIVSAGTRPNKSGRGANVWVISEKER